MALEFERIKQEVIGHSVTITSWYDDNENGWRASAPAYSFLFAARQGAFDECSSRKAAIDYVVHTLSGFFNNNCVQ